MHPLIGLAILIGTAAFVVFAFRQAMRVMGMGVIRARREDDMPAMGLRSGLRSEMGSDSGPTHPSGGDLGHS